MSNDQSATNNGPKRNNTLPSSFSCKVILDSDQLPKSSKQWTRAKKQTLSLFADHLTFNNTRTNYSEIDNATLHIYQSALFLEYAILSISSNGTVNHFGLKYDDFWKNNLPFEVQRIKEETPFLLFRKSLIIVIIIYIIYQLLINPK